MAVEYCHRGDHYVDLDINCEGKYIGNEWVCWEHLTEEEQEKLELED